MAWARARNQADYEMVSALLEWGLFRPMKIEIIVALMMGRTRVNQEHAVPSYLPFGNVMLLPMIVCLMFSNLDKHYLVAVEVDVIQEPRMLVVLVPGTLLKADDKVCVRLCSRNGLCHVQKIKLR
jgi:hypothetical protein